MAFQHHHIERIAHRGVSSLAPENSLAAFSLAVDNRDPRYSGIELDVHTTSDGAIVVHHDPILASGRRISTSLVEEIRAERLSDGSLIPTLEEAMAASAGLRLFIEAKGIDQRFDSRLLAIIRSDPDPMRCQVHGFDHRIVARIGMAAPELTTGVLSASYPIDPVSPVIAAGATVLWQQWELIDAELVARCREHGIEVIAWTVPDDMAVDWVARLGVAGVCVQA